MMDKVKISGIEYAIVMKTSEEMGGNIGLANFNTQEISINQNMTVQTIKIAKWHEVIHMLDHTYDLDMTEKQVKFFTHALIALFEDNPGIVEQFKGN
jgi:hypothetical protein